MKKTKIILLFLFLFVFVINVNSQNIEDSNSFNNLDTSQNEFEEFNETEEFEEFSELEEEQEVEKKTVSYSRLWWDIFILIATIIAGIFIKFKVTRKLRAVFLLAAIVILGFYRGGPGVISSFQNTYLFFTGLDSNWQAITLFIGLIPITYFFGKVFCGWVCYLGALQEFLYISKVKIFQTEKAQKVMKIIRIIALIVLIVQLTISKEILWNKIGPFRVAFNLFSSNLTGYILLAILLLSSLFIYRPFCKTLCPVGLVLGWVSKIPGASVLGINNSCSGCKTCNTSCKINAITRDDKISKLDNEECIRCGDCLEDCNIKSISFYNKSKNHENKIFLKGIKKIDIN
jgi:polyferredoxin